MKAVPTLGWILRYTGFLQSKPLVTGGYKAGSFKAPAPGQMIASIPHNLCENLVMTQVQQFSRSMWSICYFPAGQSRRFPYKTVSNTGCC